MRQLVTLIIGMMLIASVSLAQLKSQQAEQQQSVSQSLVHPATSINSFLGLLNPENFSMRHNFALTYLSAGGTGMSVASYTNSMFYKIADPLNVRFDVTLMGSPFGQYSSATQNDLTKLFVSRAELNYKPLENLFIKVQYSQMPYGISGYGQPYSMFNRWGDE